MAKVSRAITAKTTITGVALWNDNVKTEFNPSLIGLMSDL